MSESFNNQKMMQIGIIAGGFSAIILSLVVYLVFFGSGEKVKEYTTRAGQSFVIKMPGKVSVEYRWQLNKTKSKGLNHLKVDHIGWTYPKGEKSSKTGLFGKSRTARFSIEAQAPGMSYLTFEFKRRGIKDDTPLKTRKFRVNIIN